MVSKSLMWPSWAELFAGIPKFEAAFRHGSEFLHMTMTVKVRGVIRFICCVFCQSYALSRHTHTDTVCLCTFPALDNIYNANCVSHPVYGEGESATGKRMTSIFENQALNLQLIAAYSLSNHVSFSISNFSFEQHFFFLLYCVF